MPLWEAEKEGRRRPDHCPLLLVEEGGQWRTFRD